MTNHCSMRSVVGSSVQQRFQASSRTVEKQRTDG
jgi:hypothetical protein